MREPTMDPSTSSPLACVSAMEYRTISMMEPKLALMTAPIPIEDCAEIDATAMPASRFQEVSADPRRLLWLGLTDEVREGNDAEQCDDKDDGLIRDEAQQRANVVLFGVRDQDEKVEDGERDERGQVDEPDVDAVDGVLVVLEAGSAVGAEENRRMRTAETTLPAICGDRLGRTRRRGLADPEWIDDARSGVASRVVSVHVGRFDVGSEVLDDRLIVGRRAEVDRERLVVEMPQEDPQQLGHRDRKDESPARRRDQKEGRSDDAVEEDPVHNAAEGAHTPAMRLRIFAKVVRNDAAMPRRLDRLFARAPALTFRSAVVSSRHRRKQARMLCRAWDGRVARGRTQSAVTPPEGRLFGAVRASRWRRELGSRRFGSIGMAIVVGVEVFDPALDVLAKGPSEVCPELPDHPAVLCAPERRDEEDGRKNPAQEEEGNAEDERPDDVGRQEMMERGRRGCGVQGGLGPASNRPRLLVQSRLPDRQSEGVLDVDGLCTSKY